jgi:hypothetical protein
MRETPLDPQVNQAIVECLGPALPRLRELGPAVNRPELEQTAASRFSPEIAREVMTLYRAVTEMGVDWRTATGESVRDDLSTLLDQEAPGLTAEAKTILIACSSAFGW